MKRCFVLALALLAGACSDNSADDGGLPDLGGGGDGGGGGDLAGGDLAGVDLSTGDMVTGPDLDNHQQLQLAPDAVPLKVDGGVDYYEMHVKPGTQQVIPGAPTSIWGFDGQWPGPTIHATL